LEVLGAGHLQKVEGALGAVFSGGGLGGKEVGREVVALSRLFYPQSF